MPVPTSFVMTLSNNDVSGQRGEGYMLVPLAARKKSTTFWGWPGEFEQGEVYLERRVTVIDGGVRAEQRIYFQDTKNEFRLCTELYFAGASPDALLLVERDPEPGVNFSYSVVEPDEERYKSLVAFAKQWAPSGHKRFGYF